MAFLYLLNNDQVVNKCNTYFILNMYFVFQNYVLFIKIVLIIISWWLSNDRKDE